MLRTQRVEHKTRTKNIVHRSSAKKTKKHHDSRGRHITAVVDKLDNRSQHHDSRGRQALTSRPGDRLDGQPVNSSVFHPLCSQTFLNFYLIFVIFEFIIYKKMKIVNKEINKTYVVSIFIIFKRYKQLIIYTFITTKSLVSHFLFLH